MIHDKYFKIKAMLMLFSVSTLPLVIIFALVLGFSNIIFDSDPENIRYSLTVLSVIVAFLTIASFLFMLVIVEAVTTPIARSNKELFEILTKDEQEALMKSAKDNSFALLTNSISFYCKKKTETERFYDRMNLLSGMIIITPDITWELVNDNKLFSVTVPLQWNINYPELVFSGETSIELFSVVSPDSAIILKAAIDKAKANPKTSFTVDVRFSISKARYINAVISGYSIKCSDNTKIVSGFIRDIEQIYTANRESRNLRTMYDFVISEMSSAVFTVDAVADKITVEAVKDKNSIKILPETNSYSAFIAEYIKYIHPDNKEDYCDRFLNYDHLLISPNHSIAYEFRTADGNGDYVWMCQRVQLVQSDGERAQTVIGCIENINESKRRLLMNKYKYEIDALTGAMLGSSLQRDFEMQTGLGNRNMAILIADIISFHHINDQYGSEVGDSILCHLAVSMWKAQLVSCRVVRLDDDSFAILIRENDKLPDLAIKAADTILGRYTHPLVIDTFTVNVSVAIGGAEYTRDGDCFEDVFNAAKEALNEAKRRGENTYVDYSEIKAKTNA